LLEGQKKRVPLTQISSEEKLLAKNDHTRGNPSTLVTESKKRTNLTGEKKTGTKKQNIRSQPGEAFYFPNSHP